VVSAKTTFGPLTLTTSQREDSTIISHNTNYCVDSYSRKRCCRHRHSVHILRSKFKRPVVQHSSYVLIERPYFTINPHTTVASQSISSYLQLQTGNYDAGVGFDSESRFEAFDRTLQGLALNMQRDFESITDTVRFLCEPPRMFVRSPSYKNTSALEVTL